MGILNWGSEMSDPSLQWDWNLLTLPLTLAENIMTLPLLYEW